MPQSQESLYFDNKQKEPSTGYSQNYHKNNYNSLSLVKEIPQKPVNQIDSSFSDINSQVKQDTTRNYYVKNPCLDVNNPACGQPSSNNEYKVPTTNLKPYYYYYPANKVNQIPTVNKLPQIKNYITQSSTVIPYSQNLKVDGYFYKNFKDTRHVYNNNVDYHRQLEILKQY